MNKVKSIKYLALAIFMAMGLALTGCDLLGGDEDEENAAPTIEGFAVTGAPNNILVRGEIYSLAGTLTDDKGIKTITIDLGGAVINPVSGYAGQKEWNLATQQQSMTVADTLSGSVTLTIKVTDDDGKEQTATVSLVISDLVEYSLEAGANQSSLGSSIDLDFGAVYTGAEAAADLDEIDICYAHSGTDNNDKLFSPSHAKASGYTFTSSWGTPPVTRFHKTSLDEDDYNAIGTGLKRFDQVRDINLSRAGQTDDLELIAF